MIKNIIFDLGNVLLNFRPERFLKKYTEDEKRINKFVSIITGSETWQKLDQGSISMESARVHFSSQYPEEAELIEIFFEHWMEILTPISKNVDLLEILKSNGYKIYVLSNFINEAYDFIRQRYSFLNLFDGIVISGKIKVIKPEIGIFLHLLQKYNLNPEECLFVDDIELFVSQASALGIKTIHYLPDTDLVSELRKYEIDI
ncbi:MAG: HAD family hydrolase [Candidatus Thorarchaeota archaeon]